MHRHHTATRDIDSFVIDVDTPLQTGMERFQFRRERNDCVPFHFSLHLFDCSVFLFEVFPFKRRPSAFHFSELYGTEWNDCVS